MKDHPALYKQFFIDKQEERLGLFAALQEQYAPRKALYPGSFVHITPSFTIPEVVYVDSDRRCPKFFASEDCGAYLHARRCYTQEVEYRFHHQDFTAAIPEEQGSFDLLISLYAGFVSEHCATYLRSGGLLIANDSHGDASLANMRAAFTLEAIVDRGVGPGEEFSISSHELNSYFAMKSGRPVSEADIRQSMRGPTYARQPYTYLFRKK